VIILKSLTDVVTSKSILKLLGNAGFRGQLERQSEARLAVNEVSFA